jgi:SOS-response transcriptional repressor LexA
VKPSYHNRPGAALGEGQSRAPDIRNSRLTERQRLVLDTIRDSLATRGYGPTYRELGDALGIASTNGVADHLDRLEAKGFIERPGLARTLKLTPLAQALYAVAVAHGTAESSERTRERETDPGSIDEGES